MIKQRRLLYIPSVFLVRIEYSVRAGQIAVFKLVNNYPNGAKDSMDASTVT
jgi:hypothetical protein